MSANSVDTAVILDHSFGELRKNFSFYFILFFPIYILAFIAYSFPDIIIVHLYNKEIEYKYTTNNYLVGIFFTILESYIISIIAVKTHNKIIHKKNINKFFSQEILIYFLLTFIFYSNIDFLSGMILHFGLANTNEILNIVLIVLLFGFAIFVFISIFTIWFWALYLPNKAVGDNYDFKYIFVNSKGARLTLIFQAIIIALVVFIPSIILSFFTSFIFIEMIFTPIGVCVGIVTLSHTYIEWKAIDISRNKQ